MSDVREKLSPSFFHNQEEIFLLPLTSSKVFHFMPLCEPCKYLESKRDAERPEDG